MAYQLGDDDYLDLWKYFEERADRVKEAMFSTVTWAIGFAAAILGFIVAKLIDFESAWFKLRHAGLVLGASAAGIALCVYCWILVGESKKHMIRNWNRAKRCMKQVVGLQGIIAAVSDVEERGQEEDHESDRQKQKAVKEENKDAKVWNQVLAIVAFFALTFVALFLWAAVRAVRVL